jgi:hypothetical protein
MNYYYANPDQRALLTVGLREIADFLDQNPQVPAPPWADLLVFPPRGTDAEMFRQVDLVAEQIGVTASTDGGPAGHYVASRSFGLVQYRVIAIPEAARADRDEEAGER